MGVDGQCEANAFLNPHRTCDFFLLCTNFVKHNQESRIAVSVFFFFNISLSTATVSHQVLTISTKCISKFKKKPAHTPVGVFWFLLDPSNPVSKAPQIMDSQQ